MNDKYRKRLFQIRKRHDLTQRKMAELLRVRHGTIALWELGQRKIPGPVTLILDKYKAIYEDALISDK